MAFPLQMGSGLLSVLPGLMNMFQGKGKSSSMQDEFQKLPTMTDEQSSILKQLMSQMGGPLSAGMGNLSDILSNQPGAFEKFEKPFITQFQQQTVPGIAERFSALGSGSQGSSAFAQEMGAAGAGLSERLASMRGGLQQNALSQLMGMMQTGLGAQAFGYGHRTPQKGFWESIMPGLAQGAGQAGGAWAAKKFLG